MSFARSPADFERDDGDIVDDSDFGYMKAKVDENKDTNDEMIQLKIKGENDKK